MSSSRLPGKVLKALPYRSNYTVLEQVVQRVQAARQVNQVIVATSTDPADDAIASLCNHKKIKVFRGSLHNVLERFYQCATHYKLNQVVRITADCPCIDPSIIDRVIDEHRQQQAHFTSSAIQRTFPVGQDLSTFNYSLLEEAYQQAGQDFEKEHVTPYFYKTNSDRFRIHVVEATGTQREPLCRLTLDTAEDYDLLCAVYDELYDQDPVFSLDKILLLLQQKPWLQKLNRQSVQKKVYASLEEEIQSALNWARKNDLKRFYEWLSEQRH